jgi:hypothetical protein
MHVCKKRAFFTTWTQRDNGRMGLNYIREYQLVRFARHAVDLLIFSGAAILSCYLILQSGR